MHGGVISQTGFSGLQTSTNAHCILPAVPAVRIAKNGEICGTVATGQTPRVICDKGLACLTDAGTNLVCSVPRALPSWLQGVFTDGKLTVTPSPYQSPSSVLALATFVVHPNQLGLPAGPAHVTVFG